ncbi:MAG: hypothetical protein D6705_16625 [Deltaproteobacteria bacterium]|nr:MAG: hypothetical protein D6705_16625 [Deltaproteobacteria bacterium]
MRLAPDLPPSVRRLLFEAGVEAEPPIERRIFTNRDLNFDNVPVVGFDMDYTLAVYDQDAMEALSIACTIDKLIARGYPERLSKLEPEPHFAMRGLLVDKRLGNVLKQDRHGYVGRAYHGLRALAKAERRATYRTQRLGGERERFVPVDTLFALPEVTIYANIVELLDRHPELWSGDRPSYAEAWDDVRACIDEAHRDGTIKDRIRAAPGSFIERDADLGPTLHKLRSAGKRLFLLTNSLLPYTDALMTYLLGDAMTAYGSWQAYFDWIVVGARKPTFFREPAAFVELDGTGEPSGSEVAVPQRGRIYQGGGQEGLQRALGVHPDEVLYVGDHIYGDVVQSKKSSGWRTALVVQDLEHELAVRRDFAVELADIEHLHRLRAQLAERLSQLRHVGRTLERFEAADVVAFGADPGEADVLLETSRANLRRRYDRTRAYFEEVQAALERREAAVDRAFNPYWGSMFAERHETSWFGAQVEDFACIYTSRVSNFLFVSPSRYFHAPRGRLPHFEVFR